MQYLLVLLIALLTACESPRAPEPPPAPTASEAPPEPSVAPSAAPVPKEQPVLSTYSTPLEGNEARQFNVGHAAAALDWQTLPPGSQFSFNETVGPRTEARGYKSAPQYVAQALADGVGGGVCQVSSTLYVAAMYGGLKVTKRYAHSRPVSYTPLGTDAAVLDGELDLAFLNPYEDILTIRAGVEDGRLVVTILGREPKWEVTRIDHGGVALTEPPIQHVKSPYATKPRIIQQGKPGFSRTAIWVYTSKVDPQIAFKRLVRSRYKPVPEIWVVPQDDEWTDQELEQGWRPSRDAGEDDG